MIRPQTEQTEKKGQGGVEAVERAMSILLAFRLGEKPPTLTALCQRTHLHKTTVLRIAESLERCGMLHRLPDKRYRLGSGVMSLARVFNSMIELPEVVSGPGEKLMRNTGLSVSLYVRQAELRTCVFRSDPPHILTHTVEIGDTRPLDATATGLAFRRYQDVVSIGERCDPIFTLGVYNPDTSSMAYPVFGAHNRLVAILTLSGASHDFNQQSVAMLADEMAVAAHEIELELGRIFNDNNALSPTTQR